jgi:hypothetical protein
VTCWKRKKALFYSCVIISLCGSWLKYWSYAVLISIYIFHYVMVRVIVFHEILISPEWFKLRCFSCCLYMIVISLPLLMLTFHLHVGL